MILLMFILGVFFGMPLGWAVLLCLAMRETYPREPKSKEEWKLM